MRIGAARWPRRCATPATDRHGTASVSTGIDLAAVTPDDVSALPTMTKRDLMTHWDEIVTDSRLTLATARAHLEQVDAEGLSPLLGEYLVFTSGGTTGEPGVFCWSLAEMARFAASSLRWGDRTAGPPARLAAVGRAIDALSDGSGRAIGRRVSRTPRAGRPTHRRDRRAAQRAPARCAHYPLLDAGAARRRGGRRSAATQPPTDQPGR